jgi:hypothetical protein
MRKSIVAAATIAAVLSIGTPTRNATAMPVVTPGQLGLAGGVADSVEKTVLICGPWGFPSIISMSYKENCALPLALPL